MGKYAALPLSQIRFQAQRMLHLAAGRAKLDLEPYLTSSTHRKLGRENVRSVVWMFGLISSLNCANE